MLPLRGLPDGLDARPMTEADVDEVTALIVACELDLDGTSDVHRDDLASNFGRHGFDPALDSIIVDDRGDVVAWADVYRERAEADVHPRHRGRGIGRAVLDWTERRAARLGNPYVRQTVTDANSAAVRLFEANGYLPAFTSWVLGITFDDGPPPEPTVPDGISIRMFEMGRDDRAVYRVVEDAFNEWPERVPATFDEWAGFVRDHASFAPAVSPLAFEGEELMGAALCLDYPGGDEGWIFQVATRATHRHRGIARALLQIAFGAFYARGKKRCGLSTDSRTGALTLYERVGMSVRRSYTSYTKSLTADASPSTDADGLSSPP